MTDRLDEAGRRYDEAVENAREAIEELKLASYALGYEDAQKDAKLREISETILTPEKLAKLDQKRRDEIVAKAKADVSHLENHGEERFSAAYEDGNITYNTNFYAVEYVVNKDKRTVVAIVRHTDHNGNIKVKTVKQRGVAKCNPSDCFNVHIGKAIALRRALGLDLPSYYLNVPNPTEVRVGDVIMRKGIVSGLRVITGDRGTRPNGERYFKTKEGAGTTIESNINKIIDDSRE